MEEFKMSLLNDESNTSNGEYGIEVLVRDKSKVEISKPIYYTVSALTLGLPQTMKHFQNAKKDCPYDDFDYESDMSGVGYAEDLFLTGLVIASQVGTIGYGYYSIFEKIINH